MGVGDVLNVSAIADLLKRESAQVKVILTELNVQIITGVGQDLIPLSCREAVQKVIDKGGHRHMATLLSQVTALSEENQKLCRELKVVIDTEEVDDFNLRRQYPQQLAGVTESTKMNIRLKQSWFDFNAQITSATQTDTTLTAQCHQLLPAVETVCRGIEHLSSICPRPDVAIAENPFVAKEIVIVKEENARLDAVIRAREGLLAKLHDKSNEGDIFLKAQVLLKEVHDNLIQQQQHIAMLIEHVPRALSGQQDASANRNDFISRLNSTCTSFDDLCRALSEGSAWHLRFQDKVANELKRAQQFRMSRNMERQMCLNTASASGGKVW